MGSRLLSVGEPGAPRAPVRLFGRLRGCCARLSSLSCITGGRRVVARDSGGMLASAYYESNSGNVYNSRSHTWSTLDNIGGPTPRYAAVSVNTDNAIFVGFGREFGANVDANTRDAFFYYP